MQASRCRNGDLAYVRAVFAEMDIGEPCKPWPLEPSMVIETSPGRYHVYWLALVADPVTPEEFDGIEMCLVETYGSDPDSKDRARRLRLPGSWNVKPGRPPHQVKIIRETGACYSRAELLAAFPRPSQRKAAAHTACRPEWAGKAGVGLSRFVGRNCDGPLSAISADPYGDWLKVGMALHAETNGGAEGLALWDAWSATSEKWAPDVCGDKWNSFTASRGTTGGTIYSMAEERGWSRPIRSVHTARAPNVAQRIHGDTQPRRSQAERQDRSRAPAGRNRAAANDEGAARQQGCGAESKATRQPPHDRIKGVIDAIELTDFYAHMPSGDFIFTQGRDLWPAKSIDARIRPVKTGEVDDQGKPKAIKASAWIARHRPVEQMTWAPGKPQLIEDALVTESGLIHQRGRRVFNLYRPPTIKHGDPEQAGKWLDHVELVYPEEHRHIVKWLAARVQHPDLKINHGLILGGPPGIGKDTLLHPVAQAIGPWNMSEVSPSQLMGGFNGFIKSVILRVSEAHDLGDVDRYALYDRAKTLLAAPPEVLRVNEKHVREYNVPNVTGVIYTTNYRTECLFLPPDDRRHLATWSERSKEDFSQEYWDDLWHWYAHKQGCEHVAAYLATLNLDGFSLTAPPPKTPAFWSIAHANRSNDDAEFADVVDALFNPIALCVSHVAAKANDIDGYGGLAEWLRDRKNARRVGHRFETAGYVSVHSDTKDGCWPVNKKRQVIYVLKSLAAGDRKSAAQALANMGSLAELATWAAENGLPRADRDR
jgi:hypothetical protein